MCVRVYACVHARVFACLHACACVCVRVCGFSVQVLFPSEASDAAYNNNIARMLVYSATDFVYYGDR